MLYCATLRVADIRRHHRLDVVRSGRRVRRGCDAHRRQGVTHTQGEEAIALLIILLLWRILRVINGKSVTEHY